MSLALSPLRCFPHRRARAVGRKAQRIPPVSGCLWSLPAGDAEFSSSRHAIKAQFARAIPAVEYLSPRWQKKGERGIWQRRLREHAIRDERDFERRADYIPFNPVKHGLVRTVGEWPYSSFHRYVRRGLCIAEWAAGEEMGGVEFE